MDVFPKYFSRLVAANASQIFPSVNRPVTNAPSNYNILVEEMRKLPRDFKQSRQIAESIETGSEDIFRDFDLSTFMEHFGLDPLEKTLLALAFKLGSRPDLKTKGTQKPPCLAYCPNSPSTQVGPCECARVCVRALSSGYLCLISVLQC